MHAIYNLHNFIDQLSEPVLSHWQARCHVRDVTDQTTIYRQGDASTEMYQIVSGEIRFCHYSLEGKEVVVGLLKAGDCFGEMGLIDGLPRSSYAIAAGHTQLSVLSKKDFQFLYQAHDEIAKKINLMLVHRVRLLWQVNEDAQSLNLHQRLARTLVRLSYSHEPQECGGVYALNTSQEELGRMLGVSRQSISKELKVLEQQKCIEMRYGKIYINTEILHQSDYVSLMGQEQLTPLYKMQSPK